MKRINFFILAFFLLLMKNACPQDTIVLKPGPEGKDAAVNDPNPNTNSGNTQKFFCMGWTHSGVPGIHRSLLDFDLSMIPQNSVILNARLSLYYVCLEPTYIPQTGENESYLQLITEEWDEQTVTWNNQPLTTTEDQVYLPRSTEPEQDYTNIDVTVPVSKIVSEPVNYHGLMLRLINEYPYNCLLFASGDYLENPELRPELEIIYVPCAPTADFVYEADSLTVSFIGISPTAINWHWDFGDGDTSDIQNPVHVYQQPGFYQVCLRVEDTCYFAGHCEEVEICFAQPFAGFTYIADDLTVTFQDTSIMAAEYYWDFGDGYFSDLNNPWHNYEVSGIYQVCLTTWNSCGTDSICKLITVCSPPRSAFSFTFDELTAFFEDQSIMADEYYWDFGDGYYSNLGNPTHTYDLMGSYQVCLTTFNECDSDKYCDLLNLSSVFIPEPEAGSFVIYPNPARDVISVKSSLNGPAIISIIDLSGNEIMNQNMILKEGEPIQLHIVNIKAGLYIVRIDSRKDKSFGKLVVAR